MTAEIVEWQIVNTPEDCTIEEATEEVEKDGWRVVRTESNPGGGFSLFIERDTKYTKEDIEEHRAQGTPLVNMKEKIQARRAKENEKS